MKDKEALSAIMQGSAVSSNAVVNVLCAMDKLSDDEVRGAIRAAISSVATSAPLTGLTEEQKEEVNTAVDEGAKDLKPKVDSPPKPEA